MKRLFALVLKDLYLYRLELVLSWVCAASVICGGFWWKPPDSTGHALVVTSMFNMIFMMAYGDWLSYFERSKGTLAWLRTLPISDQSVVSAKFIAALVMQSTAFLVPILISVKQAFYPQHLLWTITAWIGVLTISSFMLFTKLILGRRFGQVVPFAVVIVVVLLASQIHERFPALWGVLAGVMFTPALLIVLELLLIVGLWQLMCRWVAGRDTPQLVD